ncbi:MAG: zonular occludens toxin domain-containing protein [Verrucomicrobiota bacterium]
MISIIEGKIGGGKTYLAVVNTIEHLAAGGTAFTNIEFDHDHVTRYLAARYGVEFDSKQLKSLPVADGLTDWWKLVDWGSLECPVLVTIDEGHLWYNAHKWKETQSKDGDMLSFLTQSRKAGVDVIFITQDKTTMNSQFRKQSQVIWSAVNLKHITLPLIGKMFGQIFVWVCRDAKSGLIMRRKFARFTMSVGRCYKTEAMLDSLMQGMAQNQRARIKRRQVKKVSVLKRIIALLELEFPILVKMRVKKESQNEIINSSVVAGWHRLGC